MKKMYIVLVVLIFSGFYTKAQVKDISFTLSPVGEYTWWDDKAGLEDGTLVGGKLGFGFGEYLELRGVYLQSIDLKTNFKDFGLVNFDPNLFTQQDINLTRWGGEFKANIGTGKLNPYVTVGTGVQKTEIDATSAKFEQVYASAGFGVKLELDKRVVLNVEAKNTTYKFNAGENLLVDADKTAFGVTDDDFSNERLSNWSVLGSLQFYLGGRRPGVLTDLDEAYLNKFKGGFRGMQLILEPSVSYIAFDDNSLFRDTYLLGGYAGIDFNEYIGVRGYYFQATENEKISTDFDNLAMYGLEVRARLNDGKGVTPYLVIGGGYLNSYNSYLGKGDVAVNSNEFASGGLGLNIPLGRNLLIAGGVRAMLTSGEDVTDITAPDEIQTHVMYNAGIKLVLGRKSEAPKDVYSRNVQRELETQQTINDAKIQNLKAEYQTKIVSLEEEIKAAYEAKDVDKAVVLLEEKKETQKALKEVEKVEGVKVEKQTEKALPKQEVAPQVASEVTPSNLIQMTPAEFESLIEKILKGLEETPEVEKTEEILPEQESSDEQNQIDLLNKRIDVLEKLLLQVNAKKTTENKVAVPDEVDNTNDEILDTQARILKKLQEINREIEINSKLIAQKDKAQTIVVSPVTEATKETVITTLNEEGEIIDNQNISEGDKLLKYNHSSAILGFNYGGASTANIGTRLHYTIDRTPLEFMPEIYIGFGEATSFGVSGNVVYPFSIKSDKVKPYIGFGLGFANINDNFHGNYNVIVGSKLPFINDKVYVDFTMRNSFRYNQLAVGYKLPF